MNPSSPGDPPLRRVSSESCRRMLSTWAKKTGAGGPKKGLKSRFFILFDDEICYYTSDLSDGRMKGCIPLRPTQAMIQVVYDVPSSYTLAIFLSTKQRHYQISFESQQTFLQWMQAIADTLKQTLKHTPMNPNLVQPGRTIKEGALFKKGKKNTAWRMRYFVLIAGEVGGESVFQYYAEMNGKLKGSIDISYQMTIMENKANADRDCAFGLSAMPKGRVYLLAAAHEAAKREWIDALRTVSLTPKYAFSLYEGVLQKRGKINTAYKERYFVLLVDSLLYFRTKIDPAPAGDIRLTAESTCSASSEAAPLRRRITLSCGKNRTFVLASQDHAAVERWTMLMKGVIEKAKLSREGGLEIDALKAGEAKMATASPTSTMSLPSSALSLPSSLPIGGLSCSSSKSTFSPLACASSSSSSSSSASSSPATLSPDTPPQSSTVLRPEDADDYVKTSEVDPIGSEATGAASPPTCSSAPTTSSGVTASVSPSPSSSSSSPPSSASSSG